MFSKGRCVPYTTYKWIMPQNRVRDSLIYLYLSRMLCNHAACSIASPWSNSFVFMAGRSQTTLLATRHRNKQHYHFCHAPDCQQDWLAGITGWLILPYPTSPRKKALFKSFLCCTLYRKKTKNALSPQQRTKSLNESDTMKHSWKKSPFYAQTPSLHISTQQTSQA